MFEQLGAIEADFEILANHLAQLIKFHADGSNSAYVDRLRVARQKSLEAAVLVRQYRKTMD